MEETQMARNLNEAAARQMRSAEALRGLGREAARQLERETAGQGCNYMRVGEMLDIRAQRLCDKLAQVRRWQAELPVAVLDLQVGELHRLLGGYD